MIELIRRYGLYLAWLVALVATGGSLYFSEVLMYLPCMLCWWQRILMYPQVLLLGIAAYVNDDRIVRYVLPLSVLGMATSGYHYLMQKFPAHMPLIQCSGGVSCVVDYIDWFGFITIPFLAFTAFTMITVILGIKAWADAREARRNR